MLFKVLGVTWPITEPPNYWPRGSSLTHEEPGQVPWKRRELQNENKVFQNLTISTLKTKVQTRDVVLAPWRSPSKSNICMLDIWRLFLLFYNSLFAFLLFVENLIAFALLHPPFPFCVKNHRKSEETKWEYIFDESLRSAFIILKFFSCLHVCCALW